MTIGLGLRCGLLALGCVAVAACSHDPGPAAPVASGEPARAGHIYLMVDRGQTLDRIAQTYRVAKQDIIAANNLTPPYTLRPGTMLEIPLAAPPAAATASKAPPKRAAAAARPAPKAKPVQTARTAGATHEAPAKHATQDVIPLD